METQPCETRSCREITQGRTPIAAISTILWRIWVGNGRPLIKTPPSWFILPWPSNTEIKKRSFEDILSNEVKKWRMIKRPLRLAFWLTKDWSNRQNYEGHNFKKGHLNDLEWPFRHRFGLFVFITPHSTSNYFYNSKNYIYFKIDSKNIKMG